MSRLNTYFVRAFAVTVSLLALAYAGQDHSGGGGFSLFEFYDLGKDSIEILAKKKSIVFEGQFVDLELLAEKFKRAKIEFTDKKLFINDVLVDLRNTPEKNLVEGTIQPWIDHPKDHRRMVIHEALGLAMIPDPQMQLSRYLTRLVEAERVSRGETADCESCGLDPSSFPELRISVTGKKFQRDRRFPNLGEAYRSEKGLLWLAPGRSLYLQDEAEAACQRRGARLPTAKELHSFSSELGAINNFDASKRIAMTVYEPNFSVWAANAPDKTPEKGEVIPGLSMVRAYWSSTVEPDSASMVAPGGPWRENYFILDNGMYIKDKNFLANYGPGHMDSFPNRDSLMNRTQFIYEGALCVFDPNDLPMDR